MHRTRRWKVFKLFFFSFNYRYTMWKELYFYDHFNSLLPVILSTPIRSTLAIISILYEPYFHLGYALKIKTMTSKNILSTARYLKNLLKNEALSSARHFFHNSYKSITSFYLLMFFYQDLK